MKYKGKSVEIIGSKILFGKETLWIHILEDNSFAQVLRSDLEDDMTASSNTGMAYVRYVAIASKIKEEMAQKRLLAPYESSLIPLPHQILVLEKVMQGIQTRFLLADEVGMGKTIEAGLIIHQQLKTGRSERILVLVPDSLQRNALKFVAHFAELTGCNSWQFSSMPMLWLQRLPMPPSPQAR